MKYRLCDLLACPQCQQFPLDLRVLETESNPEPAYLTEHPEPRCTAFCAFRNERREAQTEPPPCSRCYGAEIRQGILRCGGCQAEYPIVDGIPRFVPDVADDYPEFFQRYGKEFQSKRFQDAGRFHSLHKETKRSFGYQWLRYEVTGKEDNEEHFYARTNTRPGELAGQLFFEAGCGMGRYIQVVGANEGAEVVGLDLSLAVNRAYSENRRNPFVHVVQGNIMEMPFRPACFDHPYSIGVLHHTPDTHQAFQSMVRLVKPGGRVSVWVYHVWCPPDLKGAKAFHARLKGAVADGLRAVTTRMPLGLLHYLCYLAVPLGWLQNKIYKQPPWVRTLLSPLLIPAVGNHPEWKVRLLDTFDWYSPRYQWKHTVAEVAGWFREAGLEEIDTEGFEVTVRGRRPGQSGRPAANTRPAPSENTLQPAG